MLRDIRSELSAQRASEMRLNASKGRQAAAARRPSLGSPRQRVGRRLISHVLRAPMASSLELSAEAGGEQALYVVRCP